MALLEAAVAVVVFIGVLCAIFVYLFGAGHPADIRAGFRSQNLALLEQKFGPLAPSNEPRWHKILQSEEQTIVFEGSPLGLRQIFLVEDHMGGHWRVVVAHENAKPPVFKATELKG